MSQQEDRHHTLISVLFFVKIDFKENLTKNTSHKSKENRNDILHKEIFFCIVTIFAVIKLININTNTNIVYTCCTSHANLLHNLNHFFINTNKILINDNTNKNEICID